jgi:hypothetical protein
MKTLILLVAGLIMSLSAISSNSFSTPAALAPEEIAAEMERKFALRDQHVVRGGNTHRYIKVHH